MADFNDMFDLLNRLQSAHISVYQHRCVNVRNRHAGCRRCAQACTAGCIQLTGEGVTVEPSRCVGCGTCATVCPTQAIETHNPSDAKLFTQCVDAMERAQGRAVIACQRIAQAAASQLDAQTLATVTCLGRVDASIVVLLACVGAERVTLVHGQCAECPLSPGCRTAAAVAADARTVLDAWGCDMPVKLTGKFPSVCRLQADAGYDASKRAAFTGAGRSAKTAASISAGYAADQIVDDGGVQQVRYVHVMKDKTLPHFVPARRKRLVEGLNALGAPEDELVETGLWGHVIIDPEKCSSCRMCATFCPTGAIRKYDEADGSFGVEHHPQLCVQCRCCEDICHDGALTLSTAVFARDVAEDACERYPMKPLRYEPGNLRKIHERVRDLAGLTAEEVYDH